MFHARCGLDLEMPKFEARTAEGDSVKIDGLSSKQRLEELRKIILPLLGGN